MAHDTRGSGGSPLPDALRATIEQTAGRSLAGIRLHDDGEAARQARDYNALAYTQGRDIFIDGAQVDLGRRSGQFVVAHEVAHALTPMRGDGAGPVGSPAADPAVVRDRGVEEGAHRFAAAAVDGGAAVAPSGSRNAGQVHLFEASERGQISNLDDVVGTALGMAQASVHLAGKAGPVIDQSELVHRAGGRDALDGLGITSTPIGGLPHRYLFTCGFGMIDMRHFYQLAYISGVFWNSRATAMGRSHELNSEATSRFAPEDTPSNALGAYFGSQETGADHHDPQAFAEHLRVFLSSVHPVDFAALSPADQNTIVDFYAARGPNGVPAHPNETATPQLPPVGICGAANGANPFVVDPNDPKTIIGQTPPYSLTGDTEIRNWLAAQNDTDCGAIPAPERERLINRLLDGWVSDGDIGGVERLLRTAPSGDRAAIGGRVRLRADELWNDDQKRRLMAATGG